MDDYCYRCNKRVARPCESGYEASGCIEAERFDPMTDPVELAARACAIGVRTVYAELMDRLDDAVTAVYVPEPTSGPPKLHWVKISRPAASGEGRCYLGQYVVMAVNSDDAISLVMATPLGRVPGAQGEVLHVADTYFPVRG